uniref:non-specific serine/threonine protein kinase n=1 Tax=Fagus sylvatica TaxID=28930 RepID=A0A2N9HPE6_FAGSY
MTFSHSFFTITITLITLISFLLQTFVYSLGSVSTTTITYGNATVCGIIASEPTQRIQCYQNNRIISVQPNISFEAISGGRGFFCGLRSGGFSLICWDTSSSNSSFKPKRIYYNETIKLTDLTVGDAQVCAREVNSGIVYCWRGRNEGGSKFPSPGEALRFCAITSGSGFSCGILKNNNTVLCWGDGNIGDEIQRQFGNLSMSTLVAGESHACGLTMTGILVCKGNNGSGQLDVPLSSAYEFLGLALGANFTCAIKLRNGLVACWGGKTRFEFDSNVIENVSFESIVAGLDFACGLTSSNLSMICWGPGWSNIPSKLPLGMIIPGPCVQDSCNTCGTYPDSEALCDGSGNICKSCLIQLPVAVPLPPITTSPSPSQSIPQPNKARNKVLLVFVIVGSVGTFAGICTIVFCFWAGVCGILRKNDHNSVQPTIAEANVDTAATPHIGSNVPTSRSYSSKQQSPWILRRQRSGSSTSSKYADKTQMFSFSELSTATNNFSLENKIGAGSFGTVYKGKLMDFREVAIKRGETSIKTKKFQEKESAFDSEMALLSRLHHKHLLGLIGFCEEEDERLLVYEYMSNGALHDHLHNKNNIDRSSSILNSWKMRIKIALDAARGIEYLHNYAVPPIIHRDIKSSNILLDANWTARVSDFGLSLMGPESEQESMSIRAVGTVGYIDPEYYVLNVLTAKSDVYGLGVVLLELLTGKRAVFKNEEDGTGPMGVVEYAGPLIMEGELLKLLDKRVGPPEMNEAEAVQLLAYTALHCVHLEGKERPNMSDIVANLERALALFEANPGSLSPATLFIHSK